MSVCLKNTTEEEKEVPITYLSLETTGVGTAISQELLMENSEHYGSMVEKLEPGEEKVVMYPYEICSIWFHKKDWKNIEMRSFWMTFASYSDKIVLYLEMRNKLKTVETVPRKQQKCTASQWSEEKFNEEKNNICLMHFRCAFGVIRTEKKK